MPRAESWFPLRASRTWRLALAAALLTSPAGAKLCGDNVSGSDVPCACGDVLVSDVVLGDDPIVTAGPCPSDGLVVRVAGTARGVVINLNGTHLQGSRQGTGIWVVHGGLGGARIVSPAGSATIEGFRDGIMANGADTVALIDGVVVQDSVRDGFRLRAPGYEVRNCEAHSSGGYGFSLMGSNYRVSATRATDNEEANYYIMGQGGTLGVPGAGLVSEGGDYGFKMMGMGHRLIGCSATGASDAGLRFWGMNIHIRDCAASDNAGDGISGYGMDLQLSGNHATDNGGEGVLVDGLVRQVQDQGGNSGSGNQGLKRSGPAVQCAIAGQPCLP